MRHFYILLTFFTLFTSCEKQELAIDDNTINASFATAQLNSTNGTQIKWNVGDKLVLTNCKSVIKFEDGEMIPSSDAQYLTVTSEMISKDGLSVSFVPAIKAKEKYALLTARNFDSVLSIETDGSVVTSELEASTQLNYLASGVSTTGKFSLKGVNNIFSIGLYDSKIKYFDVSAGYTSFELIVENVPATYYFPVKPDEDLSDGIYATAYDSSCNKYKEEHYSNISFLPNQVVKLDNFLDYGSANKEIIDRILYSNDEVEATYNLEGDILKRYLDEVQYDNDYSYTNIKKYVPSSMESSSIKPAYVSVKGLKNASKVYLISNDMDIQYRSVYASESQAVYSLIPGRTYRYGVVSVDSATGNETLLKTGCIATEGRLRVIKTKEMHNVRDMGGWEALDGKHIKYGYLIRGGEVIDKNDKLDNYDPYDYDAMINHAKVDFDLDFRTDEGAGHIYVSPLGIEFKRIPLSAYDSIVEKADRQTAFKKAILLFIKNAKAGKCTYVHCQGGADRTGTFVFYIEGLLGVSDSDLCKDYEITSFYYHKERNDPERYLPMIKALQNKYGNDITIGEAIYKSARGMGITDQDIQELRDLLLE